MMKVAFVQAELQCKTRTLEHQMFFEENIGVTPCKTSDTFVLELKYMTLVSQDPRDKEIRYLDGFQPITSL